MNTCKKKSRKGSLFRRFVIVYLVSYFIFGLCFHRVRIMSASMEPTIMTGNTAFFNGIRPKLYIKRGDIVEFRKDGQILGKRIIGMPQDEVTFKDGKVFINNVLLNEPYIKDLFNEDSYDLSEHFIVPKGHYLVLGDNRDHSYDSRYWKEPYVSKKSIIGTYMFSLPKLFK